MRCFLFLKTVFFFLMCEVVSDVVSGVGDVVSGGGGGGSSSPVSCGEIS